MRVLTVDLKRFGSLENFFRALIVFRPGKTLTSGRNCLHHWFYHHLVKDFIFYADIPSANAKKSFMGKSTSTAFNQIRSDKSKVML